MSATKPDIDPPRGCVWCDCPRCGDWQESKSWTTDMADDEYEPIWFREALELDGHEDCCHHRRPVVAPRTEEGASSE